MRYSPVLHARQWWCGWRGRHVRWWLCWYALWPLRWLDARGRTWSAFDALWAAEREITWGNQAGFVDLGSGLGMGRVEFGFRSVTARAWYETHRPSVTGILRTFYVNGDAVSDGDGTSGNPWNTLAKAAIMSPTAGDRFYLRGTFTENLLVNGGTGTATNWVQYIVWPGYTCTIDNSGEEFVQPLSAASRTFMWFEGLTCVMRKPPASNPPDNCLNVQFGNDCVVMDCTLNGKLEAAYATENYWLEGNTIDLEVEDVTSEAQNAGDCITIAQPGYGDNHIIYNNTCLRPGHAGISCSGAGPLAQWNTNCRVAFNDVSAPWCAGIVMANCTDSIVECNDIHDCGTETTSVALSMESLQIGGVRCIGRYNRIWNFGNYGLLLIGGQFGGYSQHLIDCEIHHNTMWNGLGFPLFMNCRDLVNDLEFATTKVYNNLAWDYHNWTLTGDVTADYNRGYASGVWYDIIVQAPSSNPTSPAFVDWIGTSPSYVRTIGSNEIKNNMFGSSRHPGATQYMYYVSGLAGNASYAAESNALAGDMTSATLAGHIQDTDPSFVSTTVGNSQFLAIGSGSAAKNAGRAVAGVAYLGSAPDIGVYEVG